MLCACWVAAVTSILSVFGGLAVEAEAALGDPVTVGNRTKYIECLYDHFFICAEQVCSTHEVLLTFLLLPSQPDYLHASCQVAVSYPTSHWPQCKAVTV